MGELTQNGFEISGTTANRPDNVEEGQPYFNEDLGVWQVRNKAGTPVWQGPYIGVKWSMAAFGSWQLANDFLNGGIVGGQGQGGVVRATQASAMAKAFDASESGGTWGDISLTNSAGRNYAADFQFFPDDPAQTDAVAFGAAIPFCEFYLTTNSGGVNAVYDAASVLGWEYSTAVDTWSSLTLANDSTDTDDQSGGRSFQQDSAISFAPPSDWASVALDGQTAYWIRAVIQTGKGANMTTSPNQGNEHDIVSIFEGFICPHGGTITQIRASDGATGTLHTGTDVKFILFNFTTGQHSSELTWSQDIRHDSWSVLTLAVSTGDELGVLVTQEDSGNDDPTNVLLELNVSAP